MIALERRLEVSRFWLYATPVLAVGLTILSGAVMFAALGFDPLEALHAYFILPISDLYGLSELTVKATPLAMIAVGLALGFRGNVWNIGAEGQLILGAITGGGVALAFYGVEGPWLLPLMLLGGMVGGAFWAAIPAFLKVRFNANEILVSLMLTYVAGLLLVYLVTGPWKDPMGFGFPQSRLFHDSATLPTLFENSRMHIGFPIALFAVVVSWFVVSRTLIGFQIKVVGLTPPAAGYAGFSSSKVVWVTLLTTGALAGLAGVIEVSGPIGQLTPSISPGYGFTAIIVAFLGRLHPVGILLAALLMALSYIGGETAQIVMRLPLAVTGVFQGMLLFFLLASDVLAHYRIRFGSRRSEEG
ncbi:ABC transporter permease [Rhodospirillaceae bacterium KN72]|uniref:ABC transporter permease n=1 Tax=Pacificispira spongiicola TaxID=2729598 RepID=A0A7Y0DYI6_9PROT|nr:ABC transporter permease [Pacificispira spongiicola]NMM43969.1 ABC transporter permease [Pacificispira spongiicola]